MTIRKDFTQHDLIEWYRLIKRTPNDYSPHEYLNRTEIQDLLRLNHRIMEACHDIHNDNMLKKD